MSEKILIAACCSARLVRSQQLRVLPWGVLVVSIIYFSDTRPDARIMETLSTRSMPTNVSQLHWLIGGQQCCCRFLQKVSKCLNLVGGSFRKRLSSSSRRTLNVSGGFLPQELTKLPCSSFHARGAVNDGSGLDRLYCDTCQDGLGVMLEQEQRGGTTRPIKFLSRVTAPKKHIWATLESLSNGLSEKASPTNSSCYILVFNHR